MRAHIVLSENLIKEIDRLVGPRKRSAFFENAVSKEVKRLKLIASAKKAVGSLTDVSISGWETSESAARWVHDMRRKSERKSNRN